MEDGSQSSPHSSGVRGDFRLKKPGTDSEYLQVATTMEKQLKQRPHPSGTSRQRAETSWTGEVGPEAKQFQAYRELGPGSRNWLIKDMQAVFIRPRGVCVEIHTRNEANSFYTFPICWWCHHFLNPL